MSSFNKTILMGRLTRDPELKFNNDNKPICTFSLAVSDDYKKDHTHFFNITVFGKQAENCEKYLKKGSQAIVDGRLNQNRWDDNDGKKRSSISVNASFVTFLNSKSASGYDKKTDKDDDVPF